MTTAHDDDLLVVERKAVRIVVLDADGCVLLLRIQEPMHPEEGTCWDLPGGGIDSDETLPCPALRAESCSRRPAWKSNGRRGVALLGTYLGFRWWSVREVETSTERFYPGQLPVLLRRFLYGERILEPHEYFS